jgi:hypothetical protein
MAQLGFPVNKTESWAEAVGSIGMVQGATIMAAVSTSQREVGGPCGIVERKTFSQPSKVA